MSGLERFRQAQATSWDTAIGELRAGRKTSHWMWFIFPQVAGLGRSPTARHYAIADRAEAEAYLADPLLGGRLRTAAQAVFGWAGRRAAEQLLGGIDAIKLRSSMTLFEAAGGDGVFGQIIDAFYAGERDEATLRLLG